ncbi:tyrosine-type recombinase/integrase [Scytonema sp. UIC 10036]|uniref:tyrosine-type recombinase/integrase n=1 Tax=Scytonema sp. UIC 10036 TaxID=2304196 RepID=UPI0012DA784C|nr:tyrosine-type recombinase/integrase [Scytonema sp. UIC 10036]MUH00627.1 tyrosine-type recombinase/integrase [Scytonema sp. UIC 10036]
MKNTKAITKNTTKIVAIEAVATDPTPYIDVLALLLEDKRSPATRRAYEGDINHFFNTMLHSPPTRDNMKDFLSLSQVQANALVMKYKSIMVQSGLKEATVNRRLAALKSLVRYARKVGQCNFTLEDVEAEKVKQYRDTTGITQEEFKKVLGKIDRDTQLGKRDFAILLLLWTNALRRGEVSKLLVKDFDYSSRSLWILGKGKGTSKERVELPKVTADAIAAWLSTRSASSLTGDSPLFSALDFHNLGHQLCGDMISKIVQKYCKAAGINKQMSAHRIRHSSITTALDQSGGDVRKVQKLSRHAKIETLMIYDDNRLCVQGELSDLLADLF